MLIPIRHVLTGLALLGLSTLVAAAPARLPTPKPPNFTASSYLLLDYDSGQVLAEREPDLRVDPASITKLMTAYIVFSELAKSNIALDDLITISPRARKAVGSRMFIEAGSQVSVGDLLRGMIIQSGNDASIALAEHLAGGEDTFADWMTQYAKGLGMENTNYRNATGLPHAEHYSTARDIALLSRELITKFPDQYRLYSEKSFTYNDIKQNNRNNLLWRDDSVDGIKTGYTEAAGYCLVSSAQRDDMRLIAVVLGTPSSSARVRSSQALLNYGFRFFETKRVAEQGEAITQARAWKGRRDMISVGTARELFVTIPRGRADELELKPELPATLMAPILSGTALGTLEVRHGGELLHTAPLVALEDFPLGSVLQRIGDEILLFFKR